MTSTAELIKIGQAFQNKFQNKRIGNILTDWERMPVQITDEGLVITVDCNQNIKGDQLISEDMWLQLSCENDEMYAHVWNQWGVITAKPVRLVLPDCVSPLAIDEGRKAITCARKPIHVACKLLVVKNDVVIAMKQFSLDRQLSDYVLNMMFSEGTEKNPDIELLQHIVAAKNQSQL